MICRLRPKVRLTLRKKRWRGRTITRFGQGSSNARVLKAYREVSGHHVDKAKSCGHGDQNI